MKFLEKKWILLSIEIEDFAEEGIWGFIFIVKVKREEG